VLKHTLTPDIVYGDVSVLDIIVDLVPDREIRRVGEEVGSFVRLGVYRCRFWRSHLLGHAGTLDCVDTPDRPQGVRQNPL
jgi:hypothetical protein